MAYSKLTIINAALIACGHEPCVDQDGSDRWIAADAAYNRAMPLLVEKHKWGFQVVLGQLNRSGDSSLPGYVDVFDRPADCLHLENVWRTDLAQFVSGSLIGISEMGIRPPPLDYDIIDNKIHCTAPLGATAKYLSTKNTEGSWPPSFAEALTRAVESYLYQSLNEDAEAAISAMKISGGELADARVRNDQEKPRRVAFRGKFRERRRSSYYG